MTKIAKLIPLDRALHLGPVHLSLFPFFAGKIKGCTITLLCLSRERILGVRWAYCACPKLRFTVQRTIRCLRLPRGIQKKKERSDQIESAERKVFKIGGVSEVKERGGRGKWWREGNEGVSSIIIVSRPFIPIFVLFRLGFIG